MSRMSLIGCAVCAWVCVSLASQASAGLGDPLAKLFASDPTPHVNFGDVAAICGDNIIVGTYDTDEAGKYTGAAYLFDAASGQEIAKLSASDAAAYDYFAMSVAVNDSIAIVGAPHKDLYLYGGWQNNAGAVYVFDQATGQEISKLTASDANAGYCFGASVALEGTTAIVGSPWNNTAYVIDISTEQEVGRLMPGDPGAMGEFGHSSALSGSTAIVGDPWDEHAGFMSGSAYLFDLNTGQQIAKLTASDAAEGDEFGASVAICGDIAIVGAENSDQEAEDSGAAYLFDVQTGQEIAKLTMGSALYGEHFGCSVAIEGDMAVVGASNDRINGDYCGAAYVFDISAGAGRQIARLTADPAWSFQSNFGSAVDVSGDRMIVGARADSEAALWAGAAYLLEVPEPTGIILLAVGGVAVLCRRRRPSRP